MKKICILLKNIHEAGGIPRVVSFVANQLCKENDVTILSFQSNTTTKAHYIDSKIKLYDLFTSIKNYKWQFNKISKTLKKYFKDHKFDTLIIAAMDYPILLIKSIKYLKKTKLVGWEHANYTIGKPFGFKWLGRRFCLKKFDMIVVLTDRDKILYESSHKTNKIIRIYNPTDVSYFDNTIEYNFESKKIISAGSCIYQKGFDYAIEIAKIVKERHSDWSWDIYGDGPLMGELIKKVKNIGIENFLCFKGFTNNILEIYKNYSIFAMTSRYEGFGMVAIEAASNHLPIIAFDCNCGPSEIIENNVNGFLIDCFNINMFANKVCELIEDREKRISFSKQSMIKFENLEINRIANQWKQII